MFKVYAKTNYTYYVNYYKSVYDISPVKLKIPKLKFNDWAEDKINMTKSNEVENIKARVDNITLTRKEKAIMDYMHKQVKNKGYIIEKDIAIDKFNKSFIKRTVRNEGILKQYNLKRCRANKKIQKDLGITTKGYPFIIVEV